MNRKITERIGETCINNKGYEMEIIKYHSYNNITVRFTHNQEIVEGVKYNNFKKGLVKSLYSPSVYNVGYLGDGIQYENGIRVKSFIYWSNMLKRCYNKKSIEYTYRNVTVCEEWHNLKTFQDWYDNNYYEIEGEKMQLDKDILVKGNKIYSPDTCMFVPKKINMLFVKSDNTRGEYPIGVGFFKISRKYISDLSVYGGTKRLGYFDTLEDAFYAYKKAKEEYIKQIADEYKDRIPQKLYDAMYRYEVEITD